MWRCYVGGVEYRICEWNLIALALSANLIYRDILQRHQQPTSASSVLDQGSGVSVIVQCVLTAAEMRDASGNSFAKAVLSLMELQMEYRLSFNLRPYPETLQLLLK